jgi:glycosyltransferase involved in cell wall biosynthesis
VSVRALRPSDTIGDGGGAPVVVVPAAGSTDALSETLRELCAHTGAGVPLILACGETQATELRALEIDGDVALLALGAERGVAAALRAVHARAPHADLALVCEGVLVGPGWLDGLREAVLADSLAMTASPLSAPAGDPRDIATLAGAVRDASMALRPSIARARRDCCYLRAQAFELVGPPAGGGTDEDAIAELSARISAFGLVHVLADSVCVRAGADEQLLEGDSGALRRAVAVVETALRPLSVTVDARALGSAATGTRTYILDLIAALAREPSVALRVVLPHDTAPDVLALLEADAAIELVLYEQAVAGVPLTDVVHRPQQVFGTGDLALLRLLGERIVVTHHDLIAYRCGDYHESAESWQDFRRITRLALAAADMAVFPSRHARADALREDLIAPDRAHAVPHGADRLWPQPAAAALRPQGVPEGARLLVCIGADYTHKNRPFAIALAGALRERHGWDGLLVLAGPHMEHGSSREREQELLEADPILASLVIDIGAVDDAARAWLYTNAEAVVYPSVYEGFGLVPFEAAQAGVPCLYAATGALGELAGPELAPLVPWDADASADAVAPLLEPGAARERHVQALRDAARATNWASCLPQLRAIYEQAVRSPHRASRPRVREELEREAHIVGLAASSDHDRLRASELERANAEAQRANDEAQRGLHEVRGALSALQASVGGFAETPDGGFLTGAQRRGLLRVASRPLLRRILFAPFALVGRSAPPQQADADPEQP